MSKYSKKIPPKTLNNQQKVKIISEYFGVKEETALYILHRRKRGFKRVLKQNEDMYLPWTIELQNAIILSDDYVGIDWNSVQFGKEEEVLNKHEIYLKDMPKKRIRDTKPINEIKCNLHEPKKNDGWTEVISKKKKRDDKKNVILFLKSMHFP